VRALPDRWWLPGVLALAIAAAFVAVLLVKADGDPSLLVHAGPPWTEQAGARGSLTVQPADEAFDGQFFYRIGTAPWSTAETEHGVTFDLPALRNARWGYGALAWAVSFGDPDLVPWALIVVNLVAAAAVGAIGGGLAQRRSHHAIWGLLLFAWPGFAYSLSLDTSELVASAFVLGGLLALDRGIATHRWIGTAALLGAAIIVRDTTAVVAFGVLVAGVWALRPNGPDRAEGRALVGAGGVPLVLFAAWQLLVRSRFGSLPLTSSGDNNLSAPFGGLAEHLATLLPPDGGEELFRLLNIVGLFALFAAAAWTVARASSPRFGPEEAAWVFAVGVVLVLNAYLWSGATAFLRAATEAGLLSVLLLLRRGTLPLRLTAAIGLGGLWLLSAAAQVSKLG
jgi:hypothetical protein